MSLAVSGGTFYRKYGTLGCNPAGQSDPATVSNFRLDKYTVTVGRFRQFVSAWDGGWRPEAGSGMHTHLNGGQGLVNSLPRGTFEPGWITADNNSVSLTSANLTSCMGSNLTDSFQLIPYSSDTWTDIPTTQENLPMVCVNWYEAYAFCIWDGAFLPSEAEWEYAAAGGSQQREYPWGWTDPGAENRYAIYNCNYPTPTALCWGAFKIAPVGTATLGGGRWGQLDLVGNVWQWTLDDSVPYTPCIDCTALDTVVFSRVFRGGSFESDDPGLLLPTYRYSGGPSARRYDTGFRCARTP